MNTGKVWLVGAGPGDAGLITVRGREVLSQADVVVYDALVGQAILNLIPDSAKLIFAGKRAGNHYLKQSETNRVLLEEAQKGLRVVRLKGGDPFLFGRGGEELELLAENDIPFEVVPGITSAFAVPAYQGIPVTHRDFCSSVHIITGHKRENLSYDIDFEALVKTGGTLIFLMGIAAMPDICAGLIGAGMSPDMPAAVLERGTTADQRRISGTLSTLEAECERMQVRTPAIIVVGRVCELAEDFHWYDRRPLAGVRAVITRPKELVSGLADLLRQDGAEVLELPAISTRMVEDTAALDESVKALAEGGYDWLVFTSPSGVRIYLDRLLEQCDVRALAGVRIAVVGNGTAKALKPYGLRPDFVPSVYDGETLGRELAAVCSPGQRILVARAAIGEPALIEGLQKGEGLTVVDLPTYDTVYTASRVIDQRAALENGEIDFAVFTSASTVRGFAASVGEMDFSAVRAVCIGEQTRKAAAALGMQTWVSEKATLASLAECVKAAAAELKAAE